MAGKFDFGAWSRHFKAQLNAFEQRQEEFDQAITSLAMVIRSQPKPVEEPPIIMVEDPDRKKYVAFGHKLDKALLNWSQDKPIEDGIHWRTLWIRLCHKAIMGDDKEQLAQLVALYPILNGGKDELGKFLGR